MSSPHRREPRTPLLARRPLVHALQVPRRVPLRILEPDFYDASLAKDAEKTIEKDVGLREVVDGGARDARDGGPVDDSRGVEA